MVIAYSLKKAIMWLWIASSSGVATLKASEETCAQIFDDEESFGSETSSSQEGNKEKQLGSPHNATIAMQQPKEGGKRLTHALPWSIP